MILHCFYSVDIVILQNLCNVAAIILHDFYNVVIILHSFYNVDIVILLGFYNVVIIIT